MSNVRVIGGSKSDKKHINTLLKVLRATGTTYQVSYASCHRHSGGESREFENLIARVEEPIIIMIGGLSLQAVAMIETHLRNSGVFDKIVIGAPLDLHATDATMALPQGTAVLTTGYNTVNIDHNLINAALNAAKLAYMVTRKEEIKAGLIKWYADQTRKKQLEENVELDENGLIPE